MAIPSLRFVGLILAIVPNLVAAPPPVEWAKIVAVGESGRPTICYDVATDSSNNIYIGTGPNFGLGKYSPSGDFISRSGIALNDFSRIYEVHSVYVMADDSVRTAGNTYSNGSNNGFFDGVQARNGVAGHQPLAMAPNGQSLFGLWFSNDLTYGAATYSSTGYSDSVVFSQNWARRITGALNEYIDALAITDAGDALISFSSGSQSAGLAGMTMQGGTHYLAFVDQSGSGRWFKAVPGDVSVVNYQKSRAVVHHDSGDNSILWVTDFIGTTSNLGTPITTTGGSDLLMVWLTPSGTVTRSINVGTGAGDVYVNSLVKDRFGNIYMTGHFTGQLVIGGTPLTSTGAEDLFVAKLNANAQALWAFRIGSVGTDMESAVAMTTENQLIVAGTIAGGTTIGGTYLEGGGPTDAFIAKFRSEGLPPSFVASPASGVVSGGAEIRLAASVTSVLPVIYQWYFNNAPLSGQVSPTLTIPSANASHAGTYFVTARNAAGEARSETALISYTDAASLALEMRPSLTIYGTVGQTYRIEGGDVRQNPLVWTPLGTVTLDRTPLTWVDMTELTGQRIYRVILQQ